LYQSPVYRFLLYTERSDLPKKILDCGAGGRLPPLALFNAFNYETHGIEISKERMVMANNFGNERNMNLNIIQGDIRNLPYENESFSFVFSYNTIFHLTKKDIKKVMSEMHRILKKEGLCYVNFIGVEDSSYGKGGELGKGEFLQKENGEEVVHTFFEDSEVEDFIENFELLVYEKRLYQRPKNWKNYTQSYLECILQKI